MRNLWLSGLLLAVVLAGVGRADDVEEGFKSLFDGKELTGWEGNTKFWSVKEGTITGQTTTETPTDGNTFLIWRDGKVDDFELRLQYKIVGGNSGIQYRSRDLGNFVVGGYQGDFEAGDTFSGILYEEKSDRGQGVIAQRGKKVKLNAEGKVEELETLADTKDLQAKIKKEDWNDYVIIARGNHVIHKINGAVMSETIDEHAKAPKSGILALQLHAGDPMTVQFKNIRIKREKLTSGSKKLVLVAGRPSHGKGDHEHNAGVLLLKKCLDGVPNVIVHTYHNGWPHDPSAFDNADTILFYSDGGGSHPAIQEDHLIQLNKLMKRGVGMVCIHYAVEVPADRGGPELLEWLGGYFEMNWSVNPHWTAKYDKLPEHPITRGVPPFEINDEWYYHMRFREKMERVTPILTALPPKETLSRPDGPHSGNPAVREEIAAGKVQHMAWATEREDGGRGFGFTGGHFHRNWADDNFRKLVLNAILWTAKIEVPEKGVESTVSKDEMSANLDPK